MYQPLSSFERTSDYDVFEFIRQRFFVYLGYSEIVRHPAVLWIKYYFLLICYSQDGGSLPSRRLEKVAKLFKMIIIQPMATIYEFGPFRLDTHKGTLFCGDEPTELGSRGVALLQLLLENAGKPVSKHVLIHGVWPRLAIEDSNLNVQIAALRRILEASAGSSHWIETFPRRGYCFVGPLVVRDDALNEVKK